MENKEPLGDIVSRTGSNVPLWLGSENIFLNSTAGDLPVDIMLYACASRSCAVSYVFVIMRIIMFHNTWILSKCRPTKRENGWRSLWHKHCYWLLSNLSAHSFGVIRWLFFLSNWQSLKGVDSVCCNYYLILIAVRHMAITQRNLYSYDNYVQ